MAERKSALRSTPKSGRMQRVPRGVMQVPVAPLSTEDAIDLATYERLIDFCIRQGTSSLCVVLHVAESLNLSMEERKQLAKTAVDVAKGRVPVIVNVSTPGTNQAIELTRHAERIGADCVMAIAPYYWRPPEDAIEKHFAAIMAATDLPFMAYNSPAFMDGIGMTPGMIKRLLERFGEQFIGLKEASHNFETFIELQRAGKSVRPDFDLILGVEYILPSLAMGGVGSMTVSGAICPRFINQLWKAADEGRWGEARKLQDTASYLWQLCKVDYPAPVKAMMAIMGRPVGDTRLPIRPCTQERTAFLAQELRRLGLYESEPHGW